MRSWQLPVGGAARYTSRRVVFSSPFTLGQAQEIYPAGAYDIETKEEPIERGGYTALVRTATTLIVPTASGTLSRAVKADDLDEALARDAEDGRQHEPSENPDRGDADS